jgi:hypothetical protein
MMAICYACGLEMMYHISCTVTRYEGEAKDRPRYVADGDGDCHDCGCPDGGLHHPGCDNERCPACGGQAIACDCNDEDDN